MDGFDMRICLLIWPLDPDEIAGGNRDDIASTDPVTCRYNLRGILFHTTTKKNTNTHARIRIQLNFPANNS